MTRKANYSAPEFKLVSLNNEDIIMTSGEPAQATLTVSGVNVGTVAADQIFS